MTACGTLIMMIIAVIFCRTIFEMMQTSNRTKILAIGRAVNQVAMNNILIIVAVAGERYVRAYKNAALNFYFVTISGGKATISAR